MATEITKGNQDENCEDFGFLWESEMPEERTEEGFIPSHDELIVLVKFWFKELLDIAWLFDFTAPQYGSDIEERRNYANRRIARIQNIVGDERVDKAAEEVRNEFREGIGDDLWAVFAHGNEAQRDAVAEEVDAVVKRHKRRWCSLTYMSFPESFSPERTKRFSLSLTPKELADLEAASRRLAKPEAEMLRKGAALYIRAESAKRKSPGKGLK